MFIVIEKTDVQIFDARKPVKILSGGEIKTSPIVAPINIASDAINLYSQKLLDSGVFWEREKEKGNFLESKSAYSDLIKNLKAIREKFLKIANLPKETANKLLVFSILIKYLEERGNQEGKNSSKENSKGLFAKNFFKKNFAAENFSDVIRQGKIIALFDKLSQHFNGKIFEGFNSNEKTLVQETDLTELAYFLDGDSDLGSGQLFFEWRKYSFNYLPVELISSVYEVFLNERKDAVYTPEFLVNTLIDESMPQMEYEKTSVKTIDVSCGSGIFLVSAFKRLTQRHRYAKFRETDKLIHLKSDELLQIIKENIFGVDIEEDAVRLTVFSLCLALCDQLKPQEIWEELKFNETFQDNFKHRNFFDYLKENEEKLETFDLVIGNAPFDELGIKKDEGEIYYLDKDNEKVKLNLEISEKLDAKKNIFPRNQLALMFLDQSPRLLKKQGLLCLIMPAAPLLYNNTAEFRKDFFPKHQVFQILDFTNLDSILFSTVNVPAAAIFVKKQTHDEEKLISHIIIRRTTTVEEKIFFEIDKYDFHYVSQYDALNNKHIWKCNLLGGGRMNNLIERLSGLGSINNFIESNNLAYGVGYEIGSLSKQIKSAPYITLHDTLPTRAFSENGIDENQITKETAEKFHRISDERLFTPPHLLIKKNIGRHKIPTHFSDKYLTFKDSIIGIADPQNNQNHLLKLKGSFEKNKDIYRLFIAATSNEYLVGRAATILNQDIMNLPYSENKEEMQLSYVEQIICDDVLKYQIEMLSKGSAADANWKKALKGDLEKFGEVFSKALNSVYEETDKSFYLKKIYYWGEFHITEFNYGKKTKEVEEETINELIEHIESLVKTKYRSNVLLIKILKLYERNKVYIIKPKTLRYWLRSIAVKDADEVFSDLLKAGY